MVDKYKWYLFLVSAGLIFLSVLDFALQVTAQQFIFPDSTTYFAAAHELYVNFEAHDLRPMLIAAINGFPLLFGFSGKFVFGWSIFVNLCCWLGTILLLFEILKTFLSERAAFIFALLYIGCVGSAVLVFHLLAESIYTFFLFLSYYFLTKYYSHRRFLFLSLSLAVLLLSILVKPGAKLLAIAALLWFAVVLAKNLRKWPIIFIVAALSAIVFQMGMIEKRYGGWTVSYIDSFTYYNYLGARADCFRTGEEFRQCDNARYLFFSTLPYSRQKEVAAEDFKNQLLGNTGNFVKAYFYNIYVNSVNGSTAVTECSNVKGRSRFETGKFLVKVAAKLQILFFSFAGIVLGIYYFFRTRRGEMAISAASVMVLYIILISGISSDQGDRFHLVAYPFILILVAKFVSEKTKRLS
jgi:hypothetical protein